MVAEGCRGAQPHLKLATSGRLYTRTVLLAHVIMPLIYRLKTSISGAHSKPINRIAFSPDGIYVASAGDDGNLIVWLAKEAECALTFTADHAAILSLCWLGDSSNLAFGDDQGSLVQITLEEASCCAYY